MDGDLSSADSGGQPEHVVAPAVDPRDAVASLTVIDAIRESAQQGQVLTTT